MPVAFERVWVVVPAYNEGSVVAATVDDLRPYSDTVIVDHYFAPAATGQLALAAGAHVARHPVNLGQGAALATGIAYALRRGAEAVVTFDADGQHSAADAAAMVRHLDEAQVDVVLGSRFLGHAQGISPGRRMLLRLAVLFTRLTTGLALTDAHNGLRVFSRGAAETIRVRQNRMAHASEILEQIAVHRLPLSEAPCSVVYTDYSRAKGQRWTGAFSILGDLLTRRLYR